MSIFSKRRYVLVNVETKEDVYESKELLPKEVVLQDIDDDNLEEGLYRVEERVNGRKVRNAWVMRKPRTPKSPEELAAKSREDAEAFIAQDAKDIKDRVEAHKAFAAKVKETYGIEGGAVDGIRIPTGKDGNLGIIEATNLALAESAYEGIRKTRPEEVSAFISSIMNSGTTIVSGLAVMFAEKLTNRNKPSEKKKEEKKKEAETNKEVLEKKEVKKPEEAILHKESLGKGITKVTFGADASTDPAFQYQKIDTTYNDSDTPKESELPVTYEQYERDMLGINKEVEEEELEK